MKKQNKEIICMAVLVVFAVPLNSKAAYLDPGSGSFLLQLLVAGLLGAGFFIKSYWGKIKGFFTRSQSSEQEDQEDDA